jgi:2-polyprenyl-6-hydroxyphenyl methylase / 3-demethylubiquinone-9 3-methyltransferase
VEENALWCWGPNPPHDWRKFLRPDELRAFLAGEAYDVEGPFGVAFDPISGAWSQASDSAVNYMMTVKPTAA